MTEKKYTDKNFQVAPAGWRVFWARAVAGGEVVTASFPLAGWLTQTNETGDIRVLPVVPSWDGGAEALGRDSLTPDAIRVVGPGQADPDVETLKDVVRFNVNGDTRWEAKR